MAEPHEHEADGRLHVSEHLEEVTEHQVSVVEVTEHDTEYVPLATPLEKLILGIGYVVCWANVVLVGVIILQVFLRYGLGAGQVIFEELQWHLYAFAVMCGISYALVQDSHIRVDVLHMRLGEKTRHWVEIFGILFLLFPFIIVVVDHGIDFFLDSWRLNERSDAPTGLPWRWLIKAVIPLSFAMLALAAVARLIRVFHHLKGSN